MTASDPEARFEQLWRFFMGTSDVHVALARVTQKLEELQIPYAICGARALMRTAIGARPRTSTWC